MIVDYVDVDILHDLVALSITHAHRTIFVSFRDHVIRCISDDVRTRIAYDAAHKPDMT